MEPSAYDDDFKSGNEQGPSGDEEFATISESPFTVRETRQRRERPDKRTLPRPEDMGADGETLTEDHLRKFISKTTTFKQSKLTKLLEQRRHILSSVVVPLAVPDGKDHTVLRFFQQLSEVKKTQLTFRLCSFDPVEVKLTKGTVEMHQQKGKHTCHVITGLVFRDVSSIESDAGRAQLYFLVGETGESRSHRVHERCFGREKDQPTLFEAIEGVLSNQNRWNYRGVAEVGSSEGSNGKSMITITYHEHADGTTETVSGPAGPSDEAQNASASNSSQETDKEEPGSGVTAEQFISLPPVPPTPITASTKSDELTFDPEEDGYWGPDCVDPDEKLFAYPSRPYQPPSTSLMGAASLPDDPLAGQPNHSCDNERAADPSAGIPLQELNHFEDGLVTL